MRWWARIGGWAVAFSCVLFVSVQGQSLEGLSGMHPIPTWLDAWSPLWNTTGRSSSELGISASDQEIVEVPQAGLFWTAGNPAGLVLEPRPERFTYNAASTIEGGDFRRALDPKTASETALGAFGWKKLGQVGAGIGAARLTRFEQGSLFSNADLPYSGTPFIPVDTAGSDVGGAKVSAAGSGSWRVGDFALGIAAGYRARRMRTVAAPVPRLLSAADPGLAIGLAWAPTARIRMGVHSRWRAHAERLLIYSLAASSRVYLLQGYREPSPQDIASGLYSRRMDREGLLHTVSIAGDLTSISWALFVSQGNEVERQHSQNTNDPPTDAWSTSAVAAGASLLRKGEQGATFFISGRFKTSIGRATTAQVPDTTAFRHSGVRAYGVAQAIIPLSNMLTALGTFSGAWEEARRHDELQRVRSVVGRQIAALQVGLVLHVGVVNARVSTGVLSRGAGGGIPDPRQIGPAVERFVAPTLAWEVSDAAGWSGEVLLSLDVGQAHRAWVRSTFVMIAPSPRAARLEWTPSGERYSVGVTVGISTSE